MSEYAKMSTERRLDERDSLISEGVTSRKVNVKSGGRVLTVVREQYLRTDLSCQSSLCFEVSCNQGTQKRLPANVTHYLMPFLDVAGHYMDILELEQLTGIIFLQTVVTVIKFARGRLFNRICNLLKDQNKSSVFFANEFFSLTALLRNDEETLNSWRGRLVHASAVWYYEHLGGQKPIVIVTEDEAFIKAHKNSRLEVFVLKLSDYLDNFWPTLNSAKTLFESMRAAHVELRGLGNGVIRKDTGYEDHWKPEAVEAGVRSGKLFQGTIFVNKYHAANEAVVMARSPPSSQVVRTDEILIVGRVDRNRAVHGDSVAVQMLPKSEWKSKLNRLAKNESNVASTSDDNGWCGRNADDVVPTGKVVAIVSRKWKAYAASYKDIGPIAAMGQQKILVFPYDRRIPRVRVVTSQASSFVGKRIVIRIDNWPANSQHPNGHFVRCLGDIGDLDAELDAILVENDLADCTGPFSQGVFSEMPSFDVEWKPEREEIEKRVDMRDTHVVMSIDPKGCTDVDDALSVRLLPDGKVELGVHIADVTHFVKANTLTDQEAKRRATTVYLADRRFDMLPPVLSSNVCSLLGGVDRYAVSVLWELDSKSHRVTKVWYGRTIIRSRFKMTYEAAQAVIDGLVPTEALKYEVPEFSLVSSAVELDEKFEELRSNLLLLTRVAKRIQSNRELDGALKLESAEVQFEFEESSLERITPKEHLAVHETVAECMIFANHWVAKKISEAFPHQAILRRHPAPRTDAFEELKSCAASRGWQVDVWSNKVLAESLDKCVDESDPTVNFLLRSLATHAMEQAVYFSTGSQANDQWEHYGLALRHYTHFTSPIRRYADVIVHRLLMLALQKEDWWGGNETPREDDDAAALTNTELSHLCDHINDRNKAAQSVQRQSQLLFQTLFFQGRQPDDPKCIVEAVVFGIRGNGFIVYVPCYALKGPVYLQEGDDVLYIAKKQGPTWKAGTVEAEAHLVHVVPQDGKRKQTYKLFDHVTVTIQLRGFKEHARSLAFLLLGKRSSSSAATTTTAPTLEKGEMNFLQEIKRQHQRLKEIEQNDVDLPQLPASEKQRKNETFSVYQFFRRMREIGEALPETWN